ncbi:MAG: ribonuclease E/G, partial [Ilumatobacteraceae bacterium]
MTDDPHDQLPLGSTAAPAQVADTPGSQPPAGEPPADGTESIGDPTVRAGAQKRRRGSRGGRNRKKPAGAANGAADDDGDEFDDDTDGEADEDSAAFGQPADDGSSNGEDPELPKRMTEGRPSVGAAEKSLVRKPQIGDTRPAPPGQVAAAATAATATASARTAQSRGERARPDRSKSVKPKAARQPAASTAGSSDADGDADAQGADAATKKRRRGVKGTKQTGTGAFELDLDADTIERRRGRERNGRPIGRYLMAVQVRPTLTQVAVLEGRNLIEHYVSRPADDVSQIHGNIYLGKVQNVLPGMEAAFVDIGTPKNAVLYRGDVQYDPEDIVEKSGQMRIEQMLRAKQLVLCQVTKNPISAKGARLTQEVSLPGRFVVLIPNSKTYGISKRLPDDVRKRLRSALDRVKPAEHGLIVRTAAEHATEDELRADMRLLLDEWERIAAKSAKAKGPALLY